MRLRTPATWSRCIETPAFLAGLTSRSSLPFELLAPNDPLAHRREALERLPI
jgi:hypothetical protein